MHEETPPTKRTGTNEVRIRPVVATSMMDGPVPCATYQWISGMGKETSLARCVGSDDACWNADTSSKERGRNRPDGISSREEGDEQW